MAITQKINVTKALYAISKVPSNAVWGTGWRETFLCANGGIPLTVLLLMRMAAANFYDYQGKLRSKAWLRGDTVFAADAEAVNAILRKQMPPSEDCKWHQHYFAR